MFWNGFDLGWEHIAAIIGLILLGWLFVGGLTVVAITAITKPRQLLEWCLSGIVVAICAGVIVLAVIGIGLLLSLF